jgi:hypothetical protein
VDMHIYQCFGDYWNSIHNDQAGNAEGMLQKYEEIQSYSYMYED